MPVSNVGVTVDIQDAIDAWNKFNAAQGQVAVSIKEVTKELVTFNKTGQVSKTTIQGITEDDQKFVLNLKAKKGQLDVLNVSYDKTIKSTAQLAAETKKAAEALAASAAKQEAALAKLEKQHTAVRAEMEKSLFLGNSFVKFGKDLSSTFERFAFYRVFNLTTQALTDGAKAARDYQIQISLIRTISQENQLATTTWAQGLKQVSDELGLPLAETAKAAYDTVSNQIAKGTAVFDFVKEAGELARTTGGSVQDAVNLLSSAINAYNKPVSEARNLSALFFQTIDDGRIKLDDMANTFGRVAILGKGLNVTLEDITSTLAFLTQKGVTTDDSLTFLRNVFVQLEKPSKELQEFFKQIGVNSGKAAIDTFGFLEVLRKIKDEVGRGNVSVAQLFPEIRAQQPIQAALNDFGKLEEIAQKAKDTSGLLDTYANAIQIRAESPADFINKEINKLKNTFTVDIGTKLNELIRDIILFGQTLSGGSIANGLNTILVLLRNTIIEFAAFKITLVATRFVLEAYAFSQIRATATTEALAASTTKVGLTMRALPIALAAAGIAYLGTKLLLTDDLLKKNDAGLEKLIEDAKKLDQARGRQTNIIEDPNKKFIEGVEQQSRKTLGVLSQLSVENATALDRVRERNANAVSENNANFGKYIEALRNNVSKTREEISRTESSIRSISKTTLDFRQSVEDSILKTQLKYANEAQAIDLISSQIEKLRTKGRNLLLSGDATKFEEGKQVFKDIIGLQEELYEKRVDFTNKFGNRFDVKGLRPDELGATGRNNQRQLIVDVTKGLGEEQKRTLAEVNRLLVDGAKVMQKQNDIRSEGVKTEHARIKIIEDAFKSLNDATAFNATGVKAEFKNPLSGQLDPAKFAKGIETQANALRAAAGDDLKARLDVENLIATVKKQKLEEAKLEQRQANIESAQQQVGQAKEDLKTKLENNRKEFEEKGKLQQQFLDTFKGRTGSLSGAADNSQSQFFNKFLTGIARDTGDVSNFFARQFGFGGIDTSGGVTSGASNDFAAQQVGKKIAELDFFAQRYQQTLARLTSNADNVSGVLIPKAEDVQAFEGASKTLLNKFEEVIKVATLKGQPGNFDRNAPNQLLGGASPEGFKQAFLQTLKDYIRNAGEIGGLIGSSDASKTIFERTTGAITDKFLSGLDPVIQAQVKQVTALDVNSSAVDRLNATLTAIGPLPVGPGRAEGGWIGGRPGRDANLTPTTRGEFVMNAESAAAYAPTLEMMNSLKGNTFDSRSSEIYSTKVGDVNVNVYSQGGPLSNEQVRDIGRRIRTEIQRGALHGR